MKRLKSSLSAVLLAIMMATLMGCAANLPKESAGEYLDDSVITSKVKASILDQPALKVFEIHVQTFQGTVNLIGVVASQSQIDQAGEVARKVAGVRSVKNDLRLR